MENKTDLTKILSVSGQHGLFKYIAQAKNGAIVEALEDNRRTCFDIKSKITSLADISIYTDNGEEKLEKVFLSLKKVLGEKDAPSSKSSPDELKKLFTQAIPDYDESRFYVSHMKKVVDWYNELKNFASLDFDSESAPKKESAEESKA